MEQLEPYFTPPGFLARIVNRLFGRLTSLGLGPSYSFLLFTTGRKTGTARSTPVNLLQHDGRLYLVGTRGHTEWSRNARAAGTLQLKQGRTRLQFRLRLVADPEKPEILKAYLTRFRWMVGRFFPVGADAPASAFAAVAERYPVFELLAEP